MLKEAIEYARNGRAVYVVAKDLKHARILESKIGDEDHGRNIKFETAQTLGNFDWRTMRLINAHPNCVVLADHAAIEAEFSEMLKMLHRYDLNPDNGK